MSFLILTYIKIVGWSKRDKGMNKEISLKKIYGMSSKTKIIFCIEAAIIKAAFYGAFFAYKMKNIFYGIEIQDRVLVKESILQLGIAIVVVAVMNALYTCIKNDINNEAIIEIEDTLIREMNVRYMLHDIKGRMVILQSTVEKYVNLSVGFWFDVAYLCAILIIAIMYGATINLGTLLICISVSGVLVFRANKYTKEVKQKVKDSERAANQVYSGLWEINDNIEVVPFLEEQEVYRYLDDCIEKANELQIKASKVTNMSKIMMRFSHIGSVLLCGICGGIMICIGKMVVSDLIAFLIILPLISDSLFQIPLKISDYQSIKGMEDVINNFIMKEDRIIGSIKNKVSPTFDRIKINGLRYKINDEIELKVEKLLLCKGRIYGISGRSGAGKTTFLNIIAQLIVDYEGEILVENKELKAIEPKNWWNAFIYIQQENCIIPGTVEDNIVLGKRDSIDNGRLTEAISLSELQEFLEKRNGLRTIISDSNMSTGERQQICLARMFYANKDLIVLDESTSALSQQKEIKIMKTISKWAKDKNKIVIVVSHSRNVLEYCDEIVCF